MNKRLVKFLKDNPLVGGGQDGIDLYNHTYFSEIHPTITTRSLPSNNYFIIEYDNNGKGKPKRE